MSEEETVPLEDIPEAVEALRKMHLRPSLKKKTPMSGAMKQTRKVFAENITVVDDKENEEDEDGGGGSGGDDMVFMRKLGGFFKKHAPEKVKNVPLIARKYVGAESRKQLWAFLATKYVNKKIESFDDEGRDEDYVLVQLCSSAASSNVDRIIAVCAALRARGSDPDALCATFGAPALHVALSKGQDAAVDALLSLGCSVNTRDKSGGTPLMVAASSNLSSISSRALKLLLDRGADVNATDEEGLTALHEAANAGNGESVSLLLKAGADVDARAKVTLATPLHMAAAGGTAIGREDLYGALGVDFEASPDDIKRAYRKLALQLHPDRKTSAPGEMDRLKLIQRAYATLKDTQLRARYDSGYASVIDALLKGGANPNAQSNSDVESSSSSRRSSNSSSSSSSSRTYSTPADIAMRCRQWVLAAKLFVARGESVHKSHRFGRTLLHHAVAFFDAAAAKSLLALGADPNCRDSLGETPLDIAKRNSDKRMALLLGGGASAPGGGAQLGPGQ